MLTNVMTALCAIILVLSVLNLKSSYERQRLAAESLAVLEEQDREVRKTIGKIEEFLSAAE